MPIIRLILTLIDDVREYRKLLAKLPQPDAQTKRRMRWLARRTSGRLAVQYLAETDQVDNFIEWSRR
jgi:hypothetical protein